jgi:hypothetical protein
MGGAAGSGGMGGSMAVGTGGATLRAQTCTGAPPSSPLIADFEDAVPVDPAVPLIFGTPPRITGRAFVRTSSANVPMPMVRVSSGLKSKSALSISRTAHAAPGSPDYYDVGLMFDDCVDASGFRSIQFTAASSGCVVQFGAISRPNVTGSQDVRGTCSSASCDPPLMAIALSGSVRVPLPAASFDPRSVIGVIWRVPDSCALMAAIDDIQFVNP